MGFVFRFFFSFRILSLVLCRMACKRVSVVCDVRKIKSLYAFYSMILIGREYEILDEIYNDNISFSIQREKARTTAYPIWVNSGLCFVSFHSIPFVRTIFIPFLSLCQVVYQSRFSSELGILCYIHIAFTERTLKKCIVLFVGEYFVCVCLSTMQR